MENSYNIRTPYRLEVGVAAFIGKQGFISADVEYVGYTSAKISNSDVPVVDNDFDFDNEINNLTTRNAFNFRVGGEHRLNKFMLRAGFAHYASPFKDTTFEQGRNFLSGGFGYKQKKWFLDFAVVKQFETEFFYSPYSSLPKYRHTTGTSIPIVHYGNTYFRVEFLGSIMKIAIKKSQFLIRYIIKNGFILTNIWFRVKCQDQNERNA